MDEIQLACRLAASAKTPAGGVAIGRKTSHGARAKTPRRFCRNKNAKAPVHMVPAVGARAGILRLGLGCSTVVEKPNELGALPNLPGKAPLRCRGLRAGRARITSCHGFCAT
jgi:hypothetical protein